MLEELIGLLQQFDVEIITTKDKEIRDLVKEDTTQQIIKNIDHTRQTTTGVEIEKTSPTLGALIENPAMLTGYSLLVLLEELGYKFISKKDFIKQTSKFIGSRVRKSALPIQKKMLDAIRMGDVVREKRASGKGRTCSNYEVIVFESEGLRMVKQ